MIAPVLGSPRYPTPCMDSTLDQRTKLAEKIAAALLRQRHADEYASLVAASLQVVDEQTAPRPSFPRSVPS